MKLTKTVPATVQINTELIKKGDIFRVEEKLSCNQQSYIAISVNPQTVELTPINGSVAVKIIRAAEMDNYEFTKMKLVEDEITITSKVNTDPAKFDKDVFRNDLIKALNSENLCFITI